MAVSQSGEIIEKVKAIRLLKKNGHFVVGVTNEPESALARLSDRVVLIHAGKERVSSTKTFASALASAGIFATSFKMGASWSAAAKFGLLASIIAAP